MQDLLTFSFRQPNESCYNHFQNSLKLFDVLTSFPFTTSETMRDYYLYTWYIRVDSRVAKWLKM